MAIVKTFLFQKVISIASDNNNINNRDFDKTFVALFKTQFVVGIIFGLLNPGQHSFFQKTSFVAFYFVKLQQSFLTLYEEDRRRNVIVLCAYVCLLNKWACVFDFIVLNAILVVTCPTHSLNVYDKNYLLTFINIITKKARIKK